MSDFSQFILASGSPRRRELLEQRGYRFAIDVPEIDETMDDRADPVVETLRLAEEKAATVAKRYREPSTVLAADTIVVLEGKLLGKPVDAADARRMLASLSGRNHRVITAWCTTQTKGAGARTLVGFCRSDVRMTELFPAEIKEYVDGGEPMDKAGAYAVQGEGARFVAAVRGDLSNVIGLPIDQVGHALEQLGVKPSC